MSNHTTTTTTTTTTDRCPICQAIRLFDGSTHRCSGPTNDVITARESQEAEWARIDAEHVATCELPVPSCETCSEHFGVVAGS